MRHIFRHPLLLFAILLTLPFLPSCLDDDNLECPDTPLGNFEACWKAMDEHYCFFEEKGVDWDEVYHRYRPYFADSTPNMLETFNKLGEMLSEVRDGHVNLYTPFNVARYWSWWENYARNFDLGLLETYYLGTNYWISGGMKYGLLPDSIAYVYYESFGNTPGETNVDYVLAALSGAKGLIFDIRDNGGGALTGVPTIANRFSREKTCYGYIKHKTGPAHEDFSRPEPMYLEPQANRVHWDTSEAPVVILTNRHTYSAANNFVSAMRALADQGAHIRIMGDRTGGGGGMPFATVLPSGWTLRFSACPIFDHKMKSIEEGINPTTFVAMDSIHMYQNHIDDIIEAARSYINMHYEKWNDTHKN